MMLIGQKTKSTGSRRQGEGGVRVRPGGRLSSHLSSSCSSSFTNSEPFLGLIGLGVRVRVGPNSDNKLSQFRSFCSRLFHNVSQWEKVVFVRLWLMVEILLFSQTVAQP